MDALVLGAGLMGRWHAHFVRRCGGRVRGIVDPDGGRGESLARRHRGARVYADLSSALSDSDAPIVHVCTPSGTHDALVVEALSASRHVLVEKPLAADADTTRRLLEQAMSAGVLLAPVHQFRFQRGVQQLLSSEVAAPGNVVHVRGTACSAGAKGLDSGDADRIAWDIVPHFLSLARAFVPGVLDRGAWRARRPAPGELRVDGELEGRTIEVLITMNGRPPRTLLEVVGRQETGWADLFHGFSVRERGSTSRLYKAARPLLLGPRTASRAFWNLGLRGLRRQPAYPGLAELVAAFHGAASAGTPNPVDEAETLEVARVRDRLMGA